MNLFFKCWVASIAFITTTIITTLPLMKIIINITETTTTTI